MATRNRGSDGTGPRIPLGVRTLLGLVGLLLLAVVSGVAAIGVVVGLSHGQDEVDRHAVPYATWIAAAALDAKGVANDQRGFLLTGDRTFIGEADERIAGARSAFGAAATAARGDQADAVRAATAGFERWVVTVRAEFDRYLAGDRAGAVSASLGDDRAMRKDYEQALARAQESAGQAIAAAERSVDQTSTWSIAALGGVLLIAVGVGVAIIVWLMRTIAMPLFRLVRLLTPDLA